MKKIYQQLNKEMGLKFLAASLLFLCAVGLFILLAREVIFEREDLFDTKVFNFLQSFASLLLLAYCK